MLVIYDSVLFKSHEKLHTAVNTFTCNICEKTFANNIRLAKHENIHLVREPFQCKKCDKTFFQEFKLEDQKRGPSLIKG